MKRTTFLCGLLLSCTSLTAWACDNPSLVQIPEDESIPELDKFMTRVQVARYFGQMQAYVECLQGEYEASSSADALPMQRSLLAQRNNVAVAELESMRDAFVTRIGPIEELSEMDTQSCIETHSTRADSGGITPRPLDHESVLFYRRGGEIFLNVLPQRCEILRPNNSALVYEYGTTSSSRTVLCNGSYISESGGQTRACRLGPFYPVSESRAEELLERVVR